MPKRAPIVKRDLEAKTISVHGRLLSKFDNRELWRTHDFRELGLTGEAYLTIGDNISYFSDTCRTWNAGNSLRDYIPSKNDQVFANTTDDLIELIERK